MAVTYSQAKELIIITGGTAGVYYAKIHGTNDVPGNWEFLYIELQ